MTSKCDVCSSQLKNAFDFSNSPYGDSFYSNKDSALKAKKYPLSLLMCEKCMFLTLNQKIDPEFTAESFLYTTNITSGLIESYELLARELINKYKIESVLDIGSNDGSFLEIFSKKGIKTLGVEPAKYACKKANDKKIQTIQSFFNKEIALDISNSQQYDLVSANYMFANVSDINEFLENVFLVLSKSGKLLITTGYHPEQFKKGMLDYIYHEHFHYFTVKSMNSLLLKHQFYLEDIIPIPNKISSLCFIASKENTNKNKEINKKVQIYIENEYKNKLDRKKTILEFKKNYDSELERIKILLKSHKKEGKKILGFGASLSTSIFLNEKNIGNYIDEIIDDNKVKWDSYCPGWGIKVTDPNSKLFENNLVIVILAWQHSNAIYKKYSLKFKDAIWIIPFKF